MKKVLLIASLLVATVMNAQTKFESAMTKGLEQMKAAKTQTEIADAASFFERVGDAEKTQWLPYYYAALTLYKGGWDPKADKDKVAEKCKDLIGKAQAIDKNADLYCLVQQVAVLQMMVDPMTRWQVYGPVAKVALADAKKADATNPRIYYLEGMSVFNTPASFGGGKDKAKPLFAQSVELFKTYTPATPFHPNWGKEDAEKMLAQCN
ncbi:hypothetical protein [Parasediminibacterium sp. JCM 36343]|uniref:hypothetical protein n=1 Tax=Parasediminibacterium sp. JCM 36343 TaxID=3374279 RepID=UPI00397DF34F